MFIIKFLIPIIAIILSIWNIIFPMNFNGALKIKYFKKNEQNWKFSQKIYGIQILVLNIIYLIFVLIYNNLEMLTNKFLIFIIVLFVQLIPILSTYIILKIRDIFLKKEKNKLL